MAFEIAVLLAAVTGLVTWMYDRRHPYIDGRFMTSAPPPRKYPKPTRKNNKDISTKRWWG